MSATIKDMEYLFVDVLNVDQLMINDLVEIEGEIVQVMDIASLSDGYAITYQNDFGERELIETDDYAQFKLFVIE